MKISKTFDYDGDQVVIVTSTMATWVFVSVLDRMSYAVMPPTRLDEFTQEHADIARAQLIDAMNEERHDASTSTH